MRRLAQVAITFNNRTYRFQCADNEVERLELLANYLKSTLDSLMQEHGPIGDERLVIMAALTMADELFDARADIDELLEGQPDTLADTMADKLKAAAKGKALVPLAEPARKAGA